MSAPRLSRIKAEHPAWTIERTPDRSTIGYTATRNPEGEVGQAGAYGNPDQAGGIEVTDLP